ncbi:MAG: tetratricopeptide repeat protein [bacterium]|nr:MAG: tetratricopeptide repeat protein [bacterium]
MPSGKARKIIDLQQITGSHRSGISCCMIARDEEDCIATALESVRELADEVIVVDTGSRDGTPVEARRCGARVFHSNWYNDFSEARNFAISKATKEWILVLDADEMIDTADHTRILSLVLGGDASAFLFDQLTYSNARRAFGLIPVSRCAGPFRDATGYIRSEQVRLFRRRTGIHYRGAIHEEVESSLREACIKPHRAGCAIHHLGRLESSGRVYRKTRLYLTGYDSVRMRYSRNSRYLFEIAVQLLDLGYIDRAAEQAELGLTVEPNNWELLNLLGLVHLKRARHEEAERYLMRAIDVDGSIPDLHNNLGVVFMERWDYRGAIRCFERGITLDGESADLFRNAASAHLLLGNVEDAFDSITHSLSLDPYAAQSHAIHAEILHHCGERDLAMQALDTIRFLRETPLKVFLKVIQLYVRMNKIEKAIDVAEKAQGAYPGNRKLMLLMGKIHELGRNNGKAIQFYRRFLALEPENTDALNSLGCVYERIGKLEKAANSIRAALHLAPGNSRIGVNLGIILEKLGKVDDAERILRDVIGRECSYGAAYNALGCLLANRYEYKEAASLFSRAVELEPSNISFHVNLGRIREKLSRIEEGNGMIEKAAPADLTTR